MFVETRPSVDYQRKYLQEDARHTLDMHAVLHDPYKKEARRARLTAHPEERQRVDTTALRTIVPFDSFVCHPGSSLARDEAIVGSDVDFGLVITVDPVSPNQQAAFVAGLREQGFVAHTEEELEALKTAMVPNGVFSLEAQRAKQKYDQMSDSVVRFRTRTEMEARVTTQPDPLLDPLSCLYLGGAQIH